MNTFISSDRNQSLIRLGSIYLAATGPREMTDQSCEELIAYLEQSANEHGPIVGGVQYSPVSSPTVRQRRMFANSMSAFVEKSRFAFISDSQVTRGTVKAVSWLTRKDIKAFRSDQTREAIDYLREGVAFPTREAMALLHEVIRNVGLVPVRAGVEAMEASR